MEKGTKNSYNHYGYLCVCIIIGIAITIICIHCLKISNAIATGDESGIAIDLNLDIAKNNLEFVESSIPISLTYSSTKTRQCTKKTDIANYNWVNNGYIYYYKITVWTSGTLSLVETQNYMSNFETAKRKFAGFEILSDNSSTYSGEDIELCDANLMFLFTDTTGNSYSGILVRALWNDITPTTITLDKAGGTGGDDCLYSYDGAIPAGPITIPQKEGYKFLGYFNGDTQYVNSDGSIIDNPELYTNIPSTLTAHWEEQQIFTFTLVNGDETFDITYNNGQLSSTSITPPQKKGYNFLGYYAENNTTSTQYINSNGEIDQTTSLYETPFQNLYAQFEAIVYNITYLSTDEEIIPTSNPATYTIEDTIILLPPNTKQRTIFLGWSTDKITLLKDDTITNSTGDLVLYATYDISQISITLKCENYAGQPCKIYVYKGNTLLKEYLLQSEMQLALPLEDEYTDKYIIQFICPYMTTIKFTDFTNITKIDKYTLQLDTQDDKTISFYASIPYFNNTISV